MGSAGKSKTRRTGRVKWLAGGPVSAGADPSLWAPTGGRRSCTAWPWRTPAALAWPASTRSPTSPFSRKPGAHWAYSSTMTPLRELPRRPSWWTMVSGGSPPAPCARRAPRPCSLSQRTDVPGDAQPAEGPSLWPGRRALGAHRVRGASPVPRLLRSLVNLKQVIINAAHYLVLGDKETYHFDPDMPFFQMVSPATGCAGGSCGVCRPTPRALFEGVSPPFAALGCRSVPSAACGPCPGSAGVRRRQAS